MARVSVVIPCYNPGAALNRCLTSCFAQSHPNLEIILVDNNCTDGSPQVASQLAGEARVELKIVTCHDQGIAFALNEGYRHVTGDYVQWLDADDELGKDKIAHQVHSLENHPEADLAYGNWQWCFHANRERNAAVVPFPERQRDDMLLSLLANRWRPPHAHLLRRRLTDSLAGFGAWNTATSWGNDREYFTLAALLGSQFLHVPAATVRYHTWSAGQMTTTITATRRLEALSDIFQHLAAFAARKEVRLSPRHVQLLNRDWSVMECSAPDAIANEQERSLASMLHKAGTRGAIADLATTTVRSVWFQLTEATPRSPESLAMGLTRLRGAFGPKRPITQGDMSDNIALLQADPPSAAPILIPERLAVEERLHELAARGVLHRQSGHRAG